MNNSQIKLHRRKPTLKERLSPCICCGYPLTHRHHSFDFRNWGESPITYQLCASCHETLHIAINALIYKHNRAIKLWDGFCQAVGHNHPTVLFMLDKTEETAEMLFEFTMKYTDIDDDYEIEE